MKLNEIRISTLGDTCYSICASISWGGLLETIVLSAVGAIVSYGVSRLLAVIRQRNRRMLKAVGRCKSPHRF